MFLKISTMILSLGLIFCTTNKVAYSANYLKKDGLFDTGLVFKGKKLNIKNYNILQNNGSIAHQQVMHTHFHLIPKDDTHGLQIVWDPKTSVNQEEIAKLINSKD